MRLARLLVHLVLVPAAFAGRTSLLSAQRVSADVSGPNRECAYADCAINIAPRWNGLAVVRGSDGPQLANLNFFWPRDVAATLRGPSSLVSGADSAAAQARLAVRLRRIGAVLTDAGIVAGAIGAIGALHAGRVRHADGLLLATGGAALGISVPFQFAADGALSRAVWWHNRRFAR